MEETRGLMECPRYTPLPFQSCLLLQRRSLQLSQLLPQSAEGPCDTGELLAAADPDQHVPWL